VALAKTRAHVVCNGALPQATNTIADVEESVGGYGLKLAGSHLSQRASFERSLRSGQGVCEYEPSGKATAELQALFSWLCKELNVSTRRQSNANKNVKNKEKNNAQAIPSSVA
jgi:chromosome partitioning protein